MSGISSDHNIGFGKRLRQFKICFFIIVFFPKCRSHDDFILRNKKRIFFGIAVGGGSPDPKIFVYIGGEILMYGGVFLGQIIIVLIIFKKEF